MINCFYLVRSEGALRLIDDLPEGEGRVALQALHHWGQGAGEGLKVEGFRAEWAFKPSTMGAMSLGEAARGSQKYSA